MTVIKLGWFDFPERSFKAIGMGMDPDLFSAKTRLSKEQAVPVVQSWVTAKKNRGWRVQPGTDELHEYSFILISDSTGGEFAGARRLKKLKRQPILIITMGPTGSGKSNLAELVKHRMGVSTATKILIDDLVENDSAYKESVNNIIANAEFPHGMASGLTDPSESLLQMFQNAYRARRVDLDPKNESLLDIAMRRKENIVFEMMGTYIPTWLFEKATKYRIVVAYSLVRFCQLIDRNTMRASESMNHYLRDTRRNPAPRLPDIKNTTSHNKFRTTVASIQNVLNELLETCGHPKQCPVEQILVYDNNPKEMTLLFSLRDGQLSHDKGNVARLIKRAGDMNDNDCRS